MELPTNHEPFADKYFLRTRDVLRAEGLNPFVRAQVFIRQGPGQVYGIDEAVAILEKYSDLVPHGGRVFALTEGAHYDPAETLMVMEAPVQDIVALETMYLGVLSAETSKANDGTVIDLDSVRRNMAAVVDAAEGRPVSYFGPRHWRYDEDAAIARAAYEGGASSTSTDVGAATFGQKGVGTIPHALENIMAWKYGRDRAVVEATRAFDRHIDPAVPRIALIDYNNKEIDDAISVANELGDKLYGVRIDTCGENVPQAGLKDINLLKLSSQLTNEEKRYWVGSGVTISGVYAVRSALNIEGYGDAKFGLANVRIILSSGFGNVEKVKAFVRAEKLLGIGLFDELGVGGVYKSRMATMDIVAVGETLDHLIPMAKVGRGYKPNPRLQLVLGK